MLSELGKSARTVAEATADTCYLSGNFTKTDSPGIAFHDFLEHWMVSRGRPMICKLRYFNII
jgi:hypothetical protein